MEINEHQSGNVAILELLGRLTVDDHQGRLRDAVANVMRRGSRAVLLDLAGVHYIDSTRLGELITAHVTVTRQGGRLGLVNTPARVHELLSMAGLDGVFEQFPDRDTALKSIGGDRIGDR
jgi:anti-sigma B factor antagonist